MVIGSEPSGAGISALLKITDIRICIPHSMNNIPDINEVKSAKMIAVTNNFLCIHSTLLYVSF